jgi:hypothetical protein
MEPQKPPGDETSSSRPMLSSSSRRVSDVHDLHITLSPTPDVLGESSGQGVASLVPLSTSVTDTLRPQHFPGDTRPRSVSNPDVLSADISHGSRLVDVSETDTMENFSDLNRSRTQPRLKSRRRRKLDRDGNAKVMSTGEEEIRPDWTVFGELFQGHHAPLIGEQATEGGRKGSTTNTTSLGGEEPGVARSASSVIHHWRSIMANARPSRIAHDEEHGVPNAEGSSSRPVDILSRGKTKRVPANAGSPKTTQSPVMEQDIESTLPLRRVFDGDEDVLDHHRLTADYERPSRVSSRRGRSRSRSAKSLTSDSSDSSSDSDYSEPSSPPPTHNKVTATLKRLKDEIPPLSALQRNMLKCAIAYFLASLFTFIPFLSNFISDIGSFGKGSEIPSPSAHMIATVCVCLFVLIRRISEP